MVHPAQIEQLASNSPAVAGREPAPDHVSAPTAWREPATAVECALHQLAPYIGKLKSTIARDLVRSYSKSGDLLVDPFSGSGTVPLEALLLGRRVYASDISTYAATLTRAKLSAPDSAVVALSEAEDVLVRAAESPAPDLRSVPSWVRGYFHPRTLKEALAFARLCRKEGRDFLLACLLGILHHQRPGFLSYPSSHLVPYLRDKKFPRHDFPEMYDYRPLRPRILAKVQRALRRGVPPNREATFVRAPIEELILEFQFDGMITSPPYMNALDYGRDNRLRLWLLDEDSASQTETDANSSRSAFVRQMTALAQLNESHLKQNGYCVLVVGESVSRSGMLHPAQSVVELFEVHAPSLLLDKLIVDTIPDVRRARRDCRGVKREMIIVFNKRRLP